MKSIRRRPHISMTPSAETLACLRQIGDDNGLFNLGIILDFVIHDYIRIKPVVLRIPTDGDDHPDTIPEPA